MKSKYTQIFTIPNLMSFFRLLLIPVFIWLYLHAESREDHYMAAAVLLISSLTDFLDGKIARKFNMISRLGKALDPVADKLTHFAVMLCLCSRYPQLWILVALTVIKEGFMGIMGILFLRRGKMLNGAMWFGKVCTALIFAALLIFVTVTDMSDFFVNLFCGMCIVMMLFTMAMYVPVFMKMKRELTN